MNAKQKIDGFTLDISRDDRGRIVAEVWHDESGKTLAITECDTEAAAEHWGKKVIEQHKATTTEA